MKKTPHHKQYPRRIKCVMGKHFSEHGDLGWLHGFTNCGSAMVEMDGTNKIKTVGTHYFEFVDVDKNGSKV